MKTFPGKRVHLVVEHQLSEYLPFAARGTEQAEEQRERLLNGLQPGPTDAVALATVGAH